VNEYFIVTKEELYYLRPLERSIRITC